MTQIPIRVEPFDTSLKDCGFKSVVTWMSRIGPVTDFIPHSYLGGGFLPIVLIYSTMSMWIKISTLTIIFFVIGWFKPNLAIPWWMSPKPVTYANWSYKAQNRDEFPSWRAKNIWKQNPSSWKALLKIAMKLNLDWWCFSLERIYINHSIYIYLFD